MFNCAIVKRPCKNMINGLTKAGLGKPDYQLALYQHSNYVDALEQCGVNVTVLDADENFPDSTFIEDAALCTPKCAVITNPGAESRKGETDSVYQSLQKFYESIEFIKFPGNLDAGDVMMVGDHYYIGISGRTNKDGAEQLITILNKYGMTGSTVELNSMLHLKSGTAYLENNFMLLAGEFINKQEFDKFNKITVEPEETYAANSIWVNEKIIIPAGYLKTQKKVEDAGYEVITVDVSEFRKLDGGISCLSLRF
ncbi:MAG: hypothetical protein K9J16_13350 [Melioribacteraceae bacterium]|nr:hypothetical protein [Melioribacteraceae bacterium]MCF8355308.1 hypothetical protein [Melioribacteraceae bacterium]MCF8396434.1 hypothetical protein [Melioribacteraceae bacterium]MCF8420386.1 hypothetical protein [Melioribacteraceae bacterium]